MISLEIRINGELITAIKAVNRAPLCSRGLSQYEYHGMRFPFDVGTAPVAVHGFIKHRRSEGAEKLVALLCTAANKDKKE